MYELLVKIFFPTWHLEFSAFHSWKSGWLFLVQRMQNSLSWTWTSRGRFSYMRNGSLFFTICYHLCHKGTWMVLGRAARLSRTNTEKRCPFHHRILACISRKSRDTCYNGHVWPCCTKCGRTKTSTVLSNRKGKNENSNSFLELQNHWGQWL